MERMQELEKRLARIEKLLGINAEAELKPSAPNPRSPYSQKVLALMQDHLAKPEETALLLTFAGVLPPRGNNPGRDWVLSGAEPKDRTGGELSRDVAALAGSLANQHRVEICLALLEGVSSWAQLVEQLGLSPGQLYHHVRDLMNAGLVEQPERSTYRLAPLGIVSVTALALLEDFRRNTIK